jgi:hypothetical protein
MNTGEKLAINGGMAALLAKVDWSKKADEWFDSLETGTRFTSENLIEAIGLPDSRYPNSNNAVGAKIRTWSHRRAIDRVGFMKADRTVSHARTIFLWEKN